MFPGRKTTTTKQPISCFLISELFNYCIPACPILSINGLQLNGRYLISVPVRISLSVILRLQNVNQSPIPSRPANMHLTSRIVGSVLGKWGWGREDTKGRKALQSVCKRVTMHKSAVLIWEQKGLYTLYPTLMMMVGFFCHSIIASCIFSEWHRLQKHSNCSTITSH